MANVVPQMKLIVLPGMHKFIELEAIDGVRQFRKDVLRVGKFDLGDGEILEVTPQKLMMLARNTNKLLEKGHPVDFPEGHTTAATKSLGDWKPGSFKVDLDSTGRPRLYGIVKVPDAEVAGKMGKTIKNVSPRITQNYRASDGTVFEAVLEHVCATPNPVVPGQENFVECAREINEEGNVSDEDDEEESEDMAKDEPADGAQLTLADRLRALFNLDPSASEDDVFTVCHEQYTGAGDDDDQAAVTTASGEPIGDSVMSQLSRARAARKIDFERKVEEVVTKKTADLSKKYDGVITQLRKDKAQTIVDAARQTSAEVIDKETCDAALELLSSGDPKSEKHGQKLLDLAKKSGPMVGHALVNPHVVDGEEKGPGGRDPGTKATDLERATAAARRLERHGYTVELSKEDKWPLIKKLGSAGPPTRFKF